MNRPQSISCAAIEFLTLSEGVKGDIQIGFSGPHSVFLPCGKGRLFIDYAHIIDRLYLLFFGLNLSDQDFKGDALESITLPRRLRDPL